MKLYVDSREKLPLDFEVDGLVTEIIRTKLDYGDYACGWEDKSGKHVEFMPLFFERKNLSDLYGTLGKGMERFKAEIARAHENGHSLILIVEACFAEVKNGYEHSSIEGESILKTLHTLWVKHDIPYILCNDRQDMKETILHFFSAVGRNFKPGRKKHEGNHQSTHAQSEISERERKSLVEQSKHSGLRDDEKAES